jgi:hypothetical protein
VRPGDPIGRPERLREDGRWVEIDFTTRGRVEAIEEIDGPPLVSGGTSVAGRVKILRYTDGEGRRREMRGDP